MFLERDRAQAERKNHLTARYRGAEQALRDELVAAWHEARPLVSE